MPTMHKIQRPYLLCLAFMFALLAAIPCFADTVRAPAATSGVMVPAGPLPPTGGSGHSGDYVLGIGDRVHVTVFGEPDLTGDMDISSTGMISMPLVGDIKAADSTTSQLRNTITEKLKDGYMKDPKVSLEVLNYRPFFIVGEVMRPGSYNYVNGMTVINAVALAGGYTYRADKDGATIKRHDKDQEEKADADSQVGPGDVVTVPERFF